MNGKCTISLDGHSYRVPSGENLLASLLQLGVIIPHSCLAGACGSCRLYQVHGQPLLACQTTVNQPLELLTKPAERFIVALATYQVEQLSDRWCKVQAHCPLSLPLGAVFRWQLKDEVGRSVSCSITGDLLTFYFPTRLIDQLSEVRIEQGAQRAQLDISASHLILYSADNQVLAENFSRVMQDAGFEQNCPIVPIELNSTPSTLSFQRFDKALVLNDQPASLEALEQWLTSSRCRVAEFTFMTHSN